MENQIQKHQQISTSVVIRQQGKRYSLNDLGKELKNFSSVELEIIKARQNGISLCDQTEQEFEISLTGIIFSVSVICGCQLPTHEAHINALEKEFSIFLKDNGYDGLTTDEVLTAFRMNANFKLSDKVEIYGQIFNIDFASKVMRLYKNKRGCIDSKAIDIFYEQDVKAELKAQSDVRRKKVIEQFEKYLADENTELDLSNCYMQLMEDNAFKNKNITEVFHKSRLGEKKLSDLIMGNPEVWLDAKFDAEKKTVKFLFENMKKSGRLMIYDDKLNLLHPGFEIPQSMDFKPEKEHLDF